MESRGVSGQVKNTLGRDSDPTVMNVNHVPSGMEGKQATVLSLETTRSELCFR